jgi:hypothetical protein
MGAERGRSRQRAKHPVKGEHKWRLIGCAGMNFAVDGVGIVKIAIVNLVH